ncbi:hypothetical protein WP50_28450, partial [Lactiplantibacillus plantarum]
WTTFIHEHPLYLIEQGHPEKVVNMLADGIAKVVRAMAPRPVVLRFSDFKSSEYRRLLVRWLRPRALLQLLRA